MTGTRKIKEENLPRWDLSDLYPARDSAELARDLDQSAARAADIETRFKGTLAGLSGDALATAIADLEALDETLDRIGSFASLSQAENVSDPEVGRFYQTTMERLTDISTHLLFFRLEINRIPDATLAQQYKDSAALRRYRPWLDEIRKYRAHQLADDLEHLLHEKHVSGRAAWIRLFDETQADLVFPFENQNLSSQDIFDILSHDPVRARREAAGHVVAGVLQENIKLFGLITNTLAKEKATEDKWRRYPHPLAARNLDNNVEDDVVAALVTAVRASYGTLSHRYYAMKAKWLGLPALKYWDRNAPLPDQDTAYVPYGEAQKIVHAAYQKFSPVLAGLVQKFFDNAWIDVPPRAGKYSGAFSASTVPSVHPYILLNYQGRADDVMTLAHELGHGVHQILAGQAQGHLMSSTPLTLAETASVFGEMLTFQSLLAAQTDAAAKKRLIASKVEDMLNTVVRQVAFHQFEMAVHAERKNGELSTERLGDIWMQVQRESLGAAVDLDDECAVFWSYIPHFVHTPFYVYAYAFGDCLVNSLYALYRDGDAMFADKYLDLLRAGGTQSYRDLLAPFGLDARDPAFWHRGLSMISGLIDELERLDRDSAAPA